MKNRIFAFKDMMQFEGELSLFSKWYKEHESPTMYFQIHSVILEPEKLKPVWDCLENFFPDVPWVGNSTSGNIVDCEVATEISVSAVIFEKPTSKFIVRQYDYSRESVGGIAQNIVGETKENPWIKAVEIYHCISPFSTTALCEGLESEYQE